MDKQYFEKELDHSAQENARRFVEEIQRIDDEVRQLEELKAEAKEQIPSLKKEKDKKVADVLIVKDDKKRKKVIEQRKEIQNQIDELELYLEMDIKQYALEQQDKLSELAQLAVRERSEYDKMRNGLLEGIKREFNDKKDEIISAGYKHPFNHRVSTIAQEVGKRVRQQRMRESK